MIIFVVAEYVFIWTFYLWVIIKGGWMTTGNYSEMRHKSPIAIANPLLRYFP